MTNVGVFNEWGVLKETMLGSAASIYIPGFHPIEFESRRPIGERLMKRLVYGLMAGMRVPGFVQQRFVRELDALERVLEQRGVVVGLPDVVRPLPGEAPGLGQMFARDPLMVVGSLVVEGRLRIEMRRKENRGLTARLRAFEEAGVAVARLHDADAYLEGGDVLVDWPHVYVGIGKYGSNLAGANWLQAQLGASARVIPVRLRDPTILHLDCCMTLIGPARGIIHRPSLQDPLPAPLCGYDFIEISAETRRQMGVNTLMLAPDVIVVQERHVALRRELAERGLEVVAVDFSAHAALEGAFRCATAPILRESA